MTKSYMIEEARYLCDEYGMSYGQIARYLFKRYRYQTTKSTVYRWLNS